MTEPSELIEFLRTLRAVRDFTDQPVPDDALASILEVARWSGSGMNAQPWELVLVKDETLRRQLGAISQSVGHVGRAPLAIAIVMAGTWHGEPYDEGRLTERIMLAAKAHGLGACIGWFNSPETTAAAKAILGVPTDRTLRTVISLGYAAEPSGRGRKPQPRKPLAEIVSTDRYSDKQD